MAVVNATWSSLTPLGGGGNIAGTALDGKVGDLPVFVADINNETNKDFYLFVWVSLAAFTTSTSGGIKLSLRSKHGTEYADNDCEIGFASDVPSGAGSKKMGVYLRVPAAGTFGLYWTNQFDATTANSGNELYAYSYHEESDS